MTNLEIKLLFSRQLASWNWQIICYSQISWHIIRKEYAEHRMEVWKLQNDWPHKQGTEHVPKGFHSLSLRCVAWLGSKRFGQEFVEYILDASPSMHGIPYNLYRRPISPSRVPQGASQHQCLNAGLWQLQIHALHQVHSFTEILRVAGAIFVESGSKDHQRKWVNTRCEVSTAYHLSPIPSAWLQKLSFGGGNPCLHWSAHQDHHWTQA